MSIISLIQSHYTKHFTLELSISPENTWALFTHLSNTRIVYTKRYLIVPVIYKFTLDRDRHNVAMIDGPISYRATRFMTVIMVESCPTADLTTTVLKSKIYMSINDIIFKIALFLFPSLSIVCVDNDLFLKLLAIVIYCFIVHIMTWVSIFTCVKDIKSYLTREATKI